MKYLLIIAFLILYISCEKEVEYVQIPQRQIPPGYMSDKENEMIFITNQYRVDDGLYQYKTSLDLYHLAKGRVYQMVEADSLSHYGFYPAYEASGALYYGESISSNYITAASNIEGFHASENHWPMFISPIYEYIAIACEERYTVVLVARWRPYNTNGKRELEIKYIRTGNLITTEVKP
jgi:uncharacterized protein YkwD